MIEIPLDEEVAKDPYLVEGIETLSFKRDRADFLSKIHPDQEAVAASELMFQLTVEIERGETQIAGIDKDDLLFFVNLEGEHTDPRMIQGEKVYRKLQQHVQKLTGVSVDRINSVDEFWAAQFLDEE